MILSTTIQGSYYYKTHFWVKELWSKAQKSQSKIPTQVVSLHITMHLTAMPYIPYHYILKLNKPSYFNSFVHLLIFKWTKMVSVEELRYLIWWHYTLKYKHSMWIKYESSFIVNKHFLKASKIYICLSRIFACLGCQGSIPSSPCELPCMRFQNPPLSYDGCHQIRLKCHLDSRLSV